MQTLSDSSMPRVSSSFSLASAKPALGRDRDGHLVGGNQDRLAELTVPGPEFLPDALERCELKLRPVYESRNLGEVAARIAGHRLADGARRHIGLIVDGQHQAVEVLLEIVVGLGRAPFLMAGTPGRRGEAGRACHDLRLAAAAIGKQRAEQLILVGDDDDVIGRAGNDRIVGACLLARRVRRDHAHAVTPAARVVDILARVRRCWHRSGRRRA